MLKITGLSRCGTGARPRPTRRPGFYHDPFFADPGVVEDDYRRMNGLRNQPSCAPQLMAGRTPAA